MTFVKILLLVFLVKHLECVQANALSNLTLIDALESVYQFDEQLVSKIVQDLHLDPNGRLQLILPIAQRIVNASLDKLEECYDNTVGDEEVDIFHEPLGVIVHKFFKFFGHLVVSKNLAEIKNRVKALLDSVQYIGKRVVECAFNKDPEQKPTKLGLTPLSALSMEEYLRMLLPAKPQSKPGEIRLGATPLVNRPCNIDKIPPNVYQMDRFDWRDKGVVTPVQAQGGCGSCYIFGGVAALESAYLINTNSTSPNIKFSETAFLDCAERGCDGGDPRMVWLRAMDYGVTLEKDGRKYNEQSEDCKDLQPIHSKATGYCADMNLQNDDQIKAVVAHFGPVSAGVAVANNQDFIHLRGKWEQKCTSYENAGVDHNVLIVGWDKDYWIIKNSWTEVWGVDGYLYLNRNFAKNCALYFMVGVPFFNNRTDVDMAPEETQKSKSETHEQITVIKRHGSFKKFSVDSNSPLNPISFGINFGK